MPVHELPRSVSDYPRILFFGGSFDPVHLGHTTLPFEVARTLWGAGGWAVVYVPAGHSPHKDSAPSADSHRVAMMERALGDRSDALIWTYELEQETGPSFWADTWSIVRDLCRGAECRFLIGADQALAMHRWSRYRAFWTDAIVMMRGEDSVEDLIDTMRETRAWCAADLDEWRSMIVRTRLIDVSSSEIRGALGDEARRKTRIEGLDPGVQEYIVENGLYS